MSGLVAKIGAENSYFGDHIWENSDRIMTYDFKTGTKKDMEVKILLNFDLTALRIYEEEKTSEVINAVFWSI